MKLENKAWKCTIMWTFAYIAAAIIWGPLKSQGNGEGYEWARMGEGS